MNWTKRQIMAIALARQIEDEKSYIIGTGLPLIGATLAKIHTHQTLTLYLNQAFSNPVHWKYQKA